MGEEVFLEERGDTAKVWCSLRSQLVRLLFETDPCPSVELLRANDPSHMIHRISPTPLLMTVALNDTLVPTDIPLESYARAREPKALNIVPGGHFYAYSGEDFLPNITKQVDFLRDTMCAINGN